MKILTVFAHPNPRSFCHAILERFTKGLADAGHSNDVVDLYRIRFDLVFRTADFASYVHDSIPEEILRRCTSGTRARAVSGPGPALVRTRWLRDKDPRPWRSSCTTIGPGT
jgi:NAD(P)H dehydrogenase (quinone)